MTAKAPIVLVVEDEALVRVLVIEVLEERGYQVHAAGTAEAALELLRGHCQDVDVLLTDINLGAGENGLELARKARSMCPGIRVIYVTGGAYSQDLTERVPDSRLIPKPYALEQICAEVERAVRSA